VFEKGSGIDRLYIRQSGQFPVSDALDICSRHAGEAPTTCEVYNVHQGTGLFWVGSHKTLYISSWEARKMI
jgi:hypothetical protein